MNMTKDEQREQYCYLRRLGAFGPDNCVAYISEEGYLQAQEDFALEQERKRWGPLLRTAMEVVEQCAVVIVRRGECKDLYLRQTDRLLCGQIDLSDFSAGEEATVMRYVYRHLVAI